MNPDALPDDQVSLVEFEIAGARYAADLSQVIRLDFFNEACSVGTPLGPPRDGTKALTSPPIAAIWRTNVAVMGREAGAAGRKTV